MIVSSIGIEEPYRMKLVGFFRPDGRQEAMSIYLSPEQIEEANEKYAAVISNHTRD